MEGARIRIGRDGAVAHAVLARPEKLNAMDGAFFTELGERFAALSADASVRAILLSAEGRHFTAGLDLGWAAGAAPRGDDAGRNAERQLRDVEWLQRAVGAVEAARQPVVAAIHGGCIGGGVDLACACDLRVASADAFFQVAEIDVGITADLGTLQRLPRLIPGGIARELALTGRRMTADEAARWGLVNRVAGSREEAVAEGLAMAQAIAAKSPLAAAGTKRALNHARGRTVEEGLGQVALWNAGTLATADVARAAGARGAAVAFPDLD